MNKYSDRPDYELNLAVARHLGHKPSLERWVVKIEEEFAHGKIITSSDFDPCNNPEDAMPIIIENGISLINDSGKLFAAAPGVWVDGYLGGEVCGFGSYRYSENDNIYRAAMEEFLMMKDAEK